MDGSRENLNASAGRLVPLDRKHPLATLKMQRECQRGSTPLLGVSSAENFLFTSLPGNFSEDTLFTTYFLCLHSITKHSNQMLNTYVRTFSFHLVAENLASWLHHQGRRGFGSLK